MTGILAINAFLHSEKYTQQDKLLLAGAKACGINLKIYSNLELRLAVPKADFVLFWDKDVSLAHALEQQGLPVFNSAKAIALCDNKALTYQTLLCTVPQPETMVAPITYFEDCNFSPFIDGAIEHLGLPLVFKECYGSFGAQVFLCHSKEEIERHITARPFLLQKFCKASAGHDKRIEVIGGRCVAAMERYNPAEPILPTAAKCVPTPPPGRRKRWRWPQRKSWGCCSAGWICWRTAPCARSIPTPIW